MNVRSFESGVLSKPIPCDRRVRMMNKNPFFRVTVIISGLPGAKASIPMVWSGKETLRKWKKESGCETRGALREIFVPAGNGISATEARVSLWRLGGVLTEALLRLTISLTNLTISWSKRPILNWRPEHHNSSQYRTKSWIIAMIGCRQNIRVPLNSYRLPIIR